MAAQAFWKGYLKLSLVTCPVAMTPAVTDSARVRFHTLNRATGNRVQSRSIDAATGAVVEDDAQARGYQTGDDQFVILEDDELDAVALESTRTMDIDVFVQRESIASIWYDRPHYLAPSDKVGEEAFSVIRDAMAATGTVGIARLVLYRRERAVLLAPRDRGIIVWTLRYGDEVRDATPYFANRTPAKPDSAAIRLIGQLIDKHTRPWDDSLMRDPVQENLRDIIAAKQSGRGSARRKMPKPAAENVVNIMDALRRSLAAEPTR